MSITDSRFQRLDLANAAENEYAGLSEFRNILDCEDRPDDPPTPMEEQIQGWKNIPAFVEYEAYVMWEPSSSKIAAYCEFDVYHTGDNEHAADFRIEVLPAHRNKGIAREALKLLLRFAEKHGRTLLLSSTSDHIHASISWFERLGARRGLSTHINQLKVSDLDRALMEKWLRQGAENLPGFELGFFQGAYPAGLIAEIAALYQEVANDQPRDNLELEDMKFTPEFFRQHEQYIFARGIQRWTLFLRDRTHGTMAGLTEVYWHPNRARILDQGFTGIYPAYRNKGLGRWLKAWMMTRILDERPEIEFIRTGNANSNAPMLTINHEMGFKPYIARTIWQMDTAQVESYLEAGKGAMNI